MGDATENAIGGALLTLHGRPYRPCPGHFWLYHAHEPHVDPSPLEQLDGHAVHLLAQPVRPLGVRYEKVHVEVAALGGVARRDRPRGLGPGRMKFHLFGKPRLGDWC